MRQEAQVTFPIEGKSREHSQPHNDLRRFEGIRACRVAVIVAPATNVLTIFRLARGEGWFVTSQKGRLYHSLLDAKGAFALLKRVG
jgi:hypothetical protein